LASLSKSQVDDLIETCSAFDIKGEFTDGVLTLKVQKSLSFFFSINTMVYHFFFFLKKKGTEHGVHKAKAHLYDEISVIKESISDLNPPSTWVSQETNLHLEHVAKG